MASDSSPFGRTVWSVVLVQRSFLTARLQHLVIPRVIVIMNRTFRVTSRCPVHTRSRSPRVGQHTSSRPCCTAFLGLSLHGLPTRLGGQERFNARIRLKASVDQIERTLADVREETRIKDARMEASLLSKPSMAISPVQRSMSALMVMLTRP